MTNNSSSNNNELQIKARELVEKNGRAAIGIVQRKVNSFLKDCREKDSALMLLTEVEKLAAEIKLSKNPFIS